MAFKNDKIVSKLYQSFQFAVIIPFLFGVFFIMLILSQGKTTKNKFSSIKNAFRFSLGAINNGGTFQWQHKHVELMRQKLPRILTCLCIWWYKHKCFYLEDSRIFPVLTCENFCSCQRNLISFIGLAKKFIQVLLGFFFLGGGNPINASAATVKWFHLRCHYQWFLNSQSTTNAGSFFKKHVRCVCVHILCDFFFKFLENCHHKDLILGLELSSVRTGIPKCCGSATDAKLLGPTEKLTTKAGREMQKWKRGRWKRRRETERHKNDCFPY